jgi:hypothetical protein
MQRPIGPAEGAEEADYLGKSAGNFPTEPEVAQSLFYRGRKRLIPCAVRFPF